MFTRALSILFVVLILFSVMTSCGKKSTEPKVCATPIFDPASGLYSMVAFVTISSATDDATIRFTIDGTDPDLNSLVYSNVITLLTTTTIKARAYKSGWTPSEVATAFYVIE